MRTVSILALLIAVIALIVALMASQPKADPRVAAAADRVAALEKRIEALSADQARLDQAATAASAAPAPAPDGDAHVKDVVRTELQAQMAQMRGRFGGGGPAGPPPAGRGPQIPQIDAATIKDQLGFDDAKSEKVAQLAAELRTTVRDIWRQGGDRDANMAAMEKARADVEAKAAEFLSPEEVTKLKAWAEKQDAERRNRRPRPDAPADAPSDQPVKAGPQF